MVNDKEFLKYATKHMGMNSMHLEHYAKVTMDKAQHGAAFPNIQGFTPYIIEERQLNASTLDVFSRLMMDRIIFLGVGIDDYVSNVVQAQLLFLESTDPKRDIQIFVNSPGGSIIDGLGIYDTMQYINPDVATICVGMAASMGAVLLTAGKKGKRSALPHSRVMIHQPLGGMQGQVTNMEIEYNLIKQMQKQLYTIISDCTGQPYEKIHADSDRDNWFKAEEAKEYGLVDEVLTRTKSA